jgi:hypothetical protein
LPGSEPSVVGGEVECEFTGDESAQASFFAAAGAAGLGVLAMREISASVEDVVLGLALNRTQS